MKCLSCLKPINVGDIAVELSIITDFSIGVLTEKGALIPQKTNIDHVKTLFCTECFQNYVGELKRVGKSE